MRKRMKKGAGQFDWNRAQAFLATAELGSLSAAGRALGMAQPTVGRQVAALEKELDITLFDRIGKQLTLTEAGLELVDHVRQMSDAADRLLLSASGQAQEVDGCVSITAIDTIAALCLAPVIEALRLSHPGISIDILAVNEITDLGRREADIAVRNVRPTHPDLVARKICDVAARLYSSPAYLDTLGRPVTLEGLNQAQYTAFDRTDEMASTLNGFGLSLTQGNIGVISDNHLVQWEYMKRGIAIGMMMEAIGDKEPLVERVLPESEPIVFPIWLVAHPQLKSSQRIRVVFDQLASSLATLAFDAAA